MSAGSIPTALDIKWLDSHNDTETAISLGSRVMNEHDVFISTDRPACDVRTAVETALGTAFTMSTDPEPAPALVTGTTKVFFHDSHEFEDDRDFAASRYRYRISIRDSARDEQRQLAAAQRIFNAMKARGWPAMLSYNLQGNIAIYP